MHVHLREPGQAHKETIATGTAGSGGWGIHVVMHHAQHIAGERFCGDHRVDVVAQRGAVVNVFAIAAATVGSQGEKLTDFAGLRKAGAVAVTDDGKPILEDDIMREALEAAKRVRGPGNPACGGHAADLGRTLNAGAVSFRLGSRGMPVEGEAGIVRRDIDLAKKTGAHTRCAYSTPAAVEEVRGSSGVGSEGDVRGHAAPSSLTDEAVVGYDTRYKMNPRRCGRPKIAKPYLWRWKTARSMRSPRDHAPHAHHEKIAAEFDRAAFGITGLETALGLAISELHKKRGISLKRIVELMTTNPGRILALGGRGQLSIGAAGDITIFDPKKQWTFDAKQTRSKSRNTPFGGWTLTGKVVATIVDGKIVYAW